MDYINYNEWIEHLGIIMVSSASLLIVVLIVWAYQHRRRRTQMLQHSEHEGYAADQYGQSFDAHEAAHETQALLDALAPTHKPTSHPPLSPPESPHDNSEQSASELIIALFVAAAHQNYFNGVDLFAVFEELGLRYGRMKIYHHYGLGELKVEEPIFSVANMVEPGTFDPTNSEELATPGVALFMRLPGPFGGRVALELLLNHAQKLAELLEGTVLDERRKPLTAKTIEQLRQRVAQFEQQLV
ncbi:cell division protein ZipA [Thioflexithrix psekupsensis]|uniref:Cell division protein ZipA n=1 Tax=Thioflexithrix psekupsensis TaxID=1570016 RepID=A0A251X6P9_9GAMM|nr:cell division protein ZipA [Thioflexithrix psekupsensis]OUD13064.1 cell division protein ZipA [Thioflexithrix psekupsensis]